MAKTKTKTIPIAKALEIRNQEKKNKEVKIPNVKLFFDQILTTVHRQTVTESGLILPDSSGNIKTIQIVVAVGPGAGVKVGDKVEIAPERFKVKLSAPKYDVGPDKREVQVPIELIDGEPYLFMSTRELKWVYLADKKEKKNEKPV